MRVYIGGVEREFPARWYFTAPGAKRFPFPHGAEASVWLKNAEVNQAWGEVTPYPTDPTADAIRGIDRGINPGYPGQCYKGDPQWFVDGMLPAHILDGPPPPFDPCCMVGPVVASGGLRLGGSAFHSGTMLFPCTHCPNGLGQASYTLTAAGGTGDFASGNGTWVLPWQSLCNWYTGTPVNPPRWRIVYSDLNGPLINLDLFNNLASFWLLLPRNWDCTSPATADGFLTTNMTGNPPTITIH